MDIQSSLLVPRSQNLVEQIERVANWFGHLKSKTALSEQYSCLIEGLEGLLKIGQSSFLPDDIKSRFIQLANEAYGHMCAIWAHNHLMIQVLVIARELAISIGDHRSKAICDFQLSALMLALNELEESERAYHRGLKVAQELGDSEISDSAALYSIVYHTLRGEPNKVLKAYSLASNMLYQASINPFVITFGIPLTALAAAFTGQFRLGVRLLIGGRQAARSAGATAVDLALQAQLGGVLAASGDLAQARYHIEAAIDAPEDKHLPLSRYWAERSMAYLLYIEGDLKASYERMHLAQTRRSNSFFDRPSLFYHVPWILEMLQAFHLEGYDPIPGFNYKSEIDRIVNGINTHLKGVAFRLLAVEAHRKGASTSQVLEYLSSSRECLEKVGGHIELAKTMLETARAHIRNDDIEKAKPFISRAWKIYSRSAPSLFPEKMHHYIEAKLPLPTQEAYWPGHRHLMKLFDKMQLSGSGKELYQQLVILTCDFFDAERGALFIRNEETGALGLENVFNFSGFNASSPRAKWLLSVAGKALKENRPMIEDRIENDNQRRSALCIPFQACDKSHVLYLGTSYRHLLEKYPETELLLLSEHIGLQLRFVVNKFSDLEKSHKETLGQLTMAKDAGENDILFVCEAMDKLMENAKTVAQLDVPVLIQGETGVGKDLMAQYIHKQSPRNNMPFVTVDLSCASESLIESELFGHERGAFTGAEKQRIGCVELANEGTLFIDEIGEIPLAIQVKLLRVLQEKTFKRLGGMRTHHSNFRLIAATNRDLKQDVENKRFRIDLYHRLNVVPLVLPPLRDRKEDIVLLSMSFMKKFANKYNRPLPSINLSQEINLNEYSWPGNIRELKNLMERVVVMQDTSLIDNMLQKCLQPPTKTQSRLIPDELINNSKERFLTLDEVQAAYIKYVLNHTNGKIGGIDGAARALGIKRSTLYNRMKKIGVCRRDSKNIL